MSSMPCPKCKGVPLEWQGDLDAEDLLENGIMKCKTCGAEFKGIPGWKQAWEDAGRPF